MQPDSPARTLLVFRLYAPEMMFYIGFRLVKRKQALRGRNLPRPCCARCPNQAGWVNNPDAPRRLLVVGAVFFLPFIDPLIP